MRTLVAKVLQGHKSMPFVSITTPDFVSIDNPARSVAGPDRPIPQPKETSPGKTQSHGDRASTAKDSIANSANDLYSRLGSAALERGQMLDGLEDTVNSLRTGSENMVAQVGLRRL